MPVLNWIGKDAVVAHDAQVPFRLLHDVPELACPAHSSPPPLAGEGGERAARAGGGNTPANSTDNLIVEGDNLLALKALLPHYGGQVKCIYIDPPYNTGNEGWVYNDAVNSPQMREWLGKVVGKEAEDLTRHDKWLCMMYPRLKLLKRFLREDGAIFISIGKDEFGYLRALCDEIFGRQCLLECFIWQAEGNVENQEAITATHEYVLAYERMPGRSEINISVDPNVEDESKLLRDFAENSVIKNGDKNPASIIELPVGFPCSVAALHLPRHDFANQFIADVELNSGWISRDLKQKYGVEFPIRLDEMIVEGGELVSPCRVFSGWSSARKFRRFIEVGCTPLSDDDGSQLRYFLSHTGVPNYRRDGRSAHFVSTILRNMGTTERASNALERMGIRFPYPKPVLLVEYLLGLYVRHGDIVMDSFAGSGTTGEAVLKLNAEKALGLKFVLAEIDSNTARTIAAKRITSVASGYETRRGARINKVAGLGGGFRYATLGKPLFAANGHINPDVRFAELARFVWFMETGAPLQGLPPSGLRPPSPAGGGRKNNGTCEGEALSPLLGVHEGRAVYLLYNGILKDKSAGGGNVLTSKLLAELPAHDGPKTIYGTRCLIKPERLRSLRIAFKQLPYELKVAR
ncbi:MAG: site-specific DNA-methyltransferase [Proteobacteria bacterium]|nr:site-specific DNA-methyltransferase [Pseudomonadota bacterium]